MERNDDEFVSYVEFENEDGDSLTLQVLDYFEYEDGLYAILVNEEIYDEENDDMEVCVLRVEDSDDGPQFLEPDEDKIPDLQAIVERIFEENAECDCGDDCCHHDHHHDHDHIIN